jgi:hypothetical protein
LLWRNFMTESALLYIDPVAAASRRYKVASP